MLFAVLYSSALLIFKLNDEIPGSRKVLQSVVIFAPVLNVSFFAAVYGLRSILFIQDGSVSPFVRILVSILNVVYFLSFLAAPLYVLAAPGFPIGTNKTTQRSDP